MSEIFDGDPKIKVIAFYLPQFHAIPENDAAWGVGFTEWTNTKKAVPLFKGHYQPREPLDDRYYDLLDVETVKWQSVIAKQYNIFGFCYYHYWFKGGKKLLERPVEIMVSDQHIELPFCFCWANENWAKRWDGGNREVFVEQEYGSEQEWEEHFRYLLSFFKDPRYITMDGAPVFVIYRAEEIPHLSKMIGFFRKKAIEAGFPGLVIMFQHPAYERSWMYDRSAFDYYIRFEPAYSIRKLDELLGEKKPIKEYVKDIIGSRLYKRLARLKSRFGYDRQELRKIDYDEIWDIILNQPCADTKYIAGAFTDWDNTPRNKKGMLFVGSDPEKFAAYFSQLVQKVESSHAPNIIFINAWNEWGEGAYLEPDKKYGYKFLSAIKDAVTNDR